MRPIDVKKQLRSFIQPIAYECKITVGKKMACIHSRPLLNSHLICILLGTSLNVAAELQIVGRSASYTAKAIVMTSTPPRLLDQVRAVLRRKHYSLRTEEAYVGWVRRYVLFHGKR